MIRGSGERGLSRLINKAQSSLSLAKGQGTCAPTEPLSYFNTQILEIQLLIELWPPFNGGQRRRLRVTLYFYYHQQVNSLCWAQSLQRATKTFWNQLAIVKAVVRLSNLTDASFKYLDEERPWP